MSVNTTSVIPLDRAMRMIRDNMKSELLKQVEKSLRESIEPDIKRLAEKTVNSLAKFAVFNYMQKQDTMSLDAPSIHIHVQFSGEQG
jgi:hypothetical protein